MSFAAYCLEIRPVFYREDQTQWTRTSFGVYFLSMSLSVERTRRIKDEKEYQSVRREREKANVNQKDLLVTMHRVITCISSRMSMSSTGNSSTEISHVSMWVEKSKKKAFLIDQIWIERSMLSFKPTDLNWSWWSTSIFSLFILNRYSYRPCSMARGNSLTGYPTVREFESVPRYWSVRDLTLPSPSTIRFHLPPAEMSLVSVSSSSSLHFLDSWTMFQCLHRAKDAYHWLQLPMTRLRLPGRDTVSLALRAFYRTATVSDLRAAHRVVHVAHGDRARSERAFHPLKDERTDVKTTLFVIKIKDFCSCVCVHVHACCAHHINQKCFSFDRSQGD